MQTFKGYGLHLDFSSNFIPDKEADELFKGCNVLDWPIQKRPRRTSVTFGDDGLIYCIRIRNVEMYRRAIPWNKFSALEKLKKKVENLLGFAVNFCAILRYENGDVIIRKHRDKEMVNGTSIIGVSVGHTRRFKLSPPGKNDEPIILELNHGSMYCMHPPTNTYWTHEILTADPGKGMRYSLTFRNIPTDNLVKEIPTYKRCKTLLKTGERKGQECGSIIHDVTLDTCKRHTLKKFY